MERLTQRLWIVLVAGCSSTYLQIVSRPPTVPIPSFSTKSTVAGPFENPVGIQIATDTVVKPLTTSGSPNPTNPSLAQEERVLSYIYHNAAGQKALLQSSYERLDQMKNLMNHQDDRIQKLMDRLEVYEAQSKQAKETEKSGPETSSGGGAEQKKLVKLLGALPQARAVSMLQEMDDATVASLLAQMKEPEAAKLLAGFPSKRAAAITLRLALPKRS